ncbi:MAG: hypothetical protein ACW98I_14035 [Candidatus Hodarchaeales archaeon]
MAQPIVFTEIKQLLKEQENLQPFMKELEHSEKALFLYWALDSLEDDSENATLEKNRIMLKSIQDKVCTESTLESSLEKYSPGFVLGVLEYSIRSIEASIETHAEYEALVTKLESWVKIGFTNPIMEKHYQETILGIREIRGWQKMKAEEYYPYLFQLIDSSRFQRSDKQVLKFLQKRTNGDKITFYLLSQLLRTNPVLHNKVRTLCDNKEISFEEISQKFVSVMHLLGEDTSDPKVKQYIKLFLIR